MQPVTCATCNITFGLPDDLYRRRQQDGKGFHCPFGHTSVFRPSENQRLRAKVNELEVLIRTLRTEVNDWRTSYLFVSDALRETRCELTTAKLRAAGYKSAWIRLKNRSQPHAD